MADRTRIATTHVLAECQNCGKVWDNYRTAVAAARKHADDTGHAVHVERAQTWTYGRQAGSR